MHTPFSWFSTGLLSRKFIVSFSVIQFFSFTPLILFQCKKENYGFDRVELLTRTYTGYSSSGYIERRDTLSPALQADINLTFSFRTISYNNNSGNSCYAWTFTQPITDPLNHETATLSFNIDLTYLNDTILAGENLLKLDTSLIRPELPYESEVNHAIYGNIRLQDKFIAQLVDSGRLAEITFSCETQSGVKIVGKKKIYMDY